MNKQIFSLLDGQTNHKYVDELFLTDAQTDFVDNDKSHSTHDLTLVIQQSDLILSSFKHAANIVSKIFSSWYNFQSQSDIFESWIYGFEIFLIILVMLWQNLDGIQHLLMLYCAGIIHEFWIELIAIMNGEASDSPNMIFQPYLF